MADGFFPLTSEQQKWAARAADLAQRELAPRAAETDRTATFPSVGLDALKKEGFWGLHLTPAVGHLMLASSLTAKLAGHCQPRAGDAAILLKKTSFTRWPAGPNGEACLLRLS